MRTAAANGRQGASDGNSSTDAAASVLQYKNDLWSARLSREVASGTRWRWLASAGAGARVLASVQFVDENGGGPG
jgi:hypothetical protein